MDYCSDINRNDPTRDILRKIGVKKKFFFKNFMIGLILEILLCTLAFIFQDGLISIAVSVYNLPAYDCRRIFISSMWIWLLFLVQFALVPYISATMIESHLQKDE